MMRAMPRSLAGRVFVGAVVTALVFAACFGLLSRSLVTWLLHVQLARNGVAIGDSLRAGAIDAVATGNVVGLHAQLRSAAESNPHVRYIAVLDGACHLATHTLARPPSQAFVDALCAPRVGTSVVFRTEIGDLHDIARQGDRHDGVRVHVGIDERWVGESLGVFAVLFSTAGAAGLLGGLGVAWWLARHIGGPLRAMAADADRIARAARANEPLAFADRPLTGIAEVDGLARSFADMTQGLLQAQQRLASTQAQMIRAERMAALGSFVAGTAHAINNPLGGVRACLEMVGSAAGDIGRLKKYLSVADEGLGRIDALVRRLVQFARQGGDVRRRVDLCQLVHQSLVVENVVGRQSHAVAIDLGLAHEPCWVLADPAELEQALTALVVNAHQATPAGGRVRVAVEPASDGVRLSVDDSGPGVPAELRDKVFEPFFSTKPEGQGTGLGLWVVWGVVERLGGSVRATDSALGGARFEVWLPMAAAEVPHA